MCSNDTLLKPRPDLAEEFEAWKVFEFNAESNAIEGLYFNSNGSGNVVGTGNYPLGMEAGGQVVMPEPYPTNRWIKSERGHGFHVFLNHEEANRYGRTHFRTLSGARVLKVYCKGPAQQCINDVYFGEYIVVSELYIPFAN